MARVLLLTRGDSHWGLGHLHRVTWLADALATQQQPRFHPAVCCLDSPEAREFWTGRKQDVSFVPPDEDSVALGARLALELSRESIVVADWLDSPPALVCALRGSGAHVVLLDDYGPARPHAGLVINALLAPLASSAERIGRAQVLSGIDYIQLPPAVTKLRGTAAATARAMETELAAPPAPTAEVHCLLISFGGSYQPELIELALAALEQAGYGGRAVVIPAPALPPRTGGIDVEPVPAGEQFHSLLAASDLAICGGGLTLYEAAFLGVPAIAIAVPSPVAGHEGHQLGTIHKLAEAGCCRALGMAGEVGTEVLAAAVRELLADPSQRGRMSAAGLRLTDGRGLMRTVEEIIALARSPRTAPPGAAP